MFHRKWPGVAGGLFLLAFLAAGCEKPAGRAAAPEAAGPRMSAEDLGLLQGAKTSGAWNGAPMPGLTLEQTERQVVYEAKISAVIQTLMKDPSKTSTNDFGSVVINTDGVADLPTILGEAGYKDYMANVKAINFARVAAAAGPDRK